MVKIILYPLLLLSVSQMALSQNLVPQEGGIIPSETTPYQMRERMRQIAITQAKIYNMPHLLLVEICWKESGLQHNAKGLDNRARRKTRRKRTLADYSYGLCQIKLSTARWVWSRLVAKEHRRKDIEVWHLDNPNFNAATAAILMLWLKSKFKRWRPSLAAYNAGPYRCFAINTTRQSCRLKRPSELAMGKGTYSMSIYTRWRKAKLKTTMRMIRNKTITLVGIHQTN